MDYFSMFSGIGGFEYGIGENGNCIGFSEIDKYAKSIYRKHFPNHTDYGDARQIRCEELPDFQLLVGGFPCQAFSIAGKGRGFNDTRGTLFFEIQRILHEKKPPYLVLENVRGLLSNDKGKTFQKILGILSDLGYQLEWALLNSKDFGVPQNRERVFIVGHLGGGGSRQILPVTGTNGETLNQLGSIGKNSEVNRVYDTTLSRTIKNGGGIGAKTGLYMIPNNDKSTCLDGNYFKGPNTGNKVNRTRVVQPVLTPDRIKKGQNGRRFKNDGEPSFTCTSQDRHGVYDGTRIRRLTPTECERLQGFPDGWTEKGLLDSGETTMVSDTQRYKCLGNAVTTTVITAIIKKLLEDRL